MAESCEADTPNWFKKKKIRPTRSIASKYASEIAK